VAPALIVLLALIFPATAGSQGQWEQVMSPRLGVADVNPRGAREQHIERFGFYRSAGIGVLRVDEGSWRDLESAPGSWNLPSNLSSYFSLAQSYGFRLKSGIGALYSPAAWFLKQNPDSQLIGRSERKGEAPIASTEVISYWYPGLHDLLEAKDDQIFSYLNTHGLLHNVRYLVVPGGPAAEPIYPAPWTTSDPTGPPRFWCYDDHARSSFVAAARTRYRTIAAANSAWNTAYANWGVVKIPLPGEKPGQMWDDVLSWYRDSKREFFAWQVAHYERLRRKYWPSGARPTLVILVPGEHFTSGSWSGAVRTGAGDACIRAMCDSGFLLDTAAAAGAAVQYTGMPAMGELEYLKSYIRDHGYSLDVWGENAGNEGDPAELGYEVLSNGLYGQEYIGANLFEADQTTPSKKFANLSAEYSWLRSVWEGRVAFSLSTNDTTLVTGACLYTDKAGEHQLCMQGDGRLALKEQQKTLWRSELHDAQTTHCAQPEKCKAVFQGDGNLVVYDGTQPLWASGAAGKGATLALTSAKPYVFVKDASGKVIWQPELAN
jgi:hypothetical protein